MFYMFFSKPIFKLCFSCHFIAADAPIEVDTKVRYKGILIKYYLYEYYQWLPCIINFYVYCCYSFVFFLALPWHCCTVHVKSHVLHFGWSSSKVPQTSPDSSYVPWHARSIHEESKLRVSVHLHLCREKKRESNYRKNWPYTNNKVVLAVKQGNAGRRTEENN